MKKLSKLIALILSLAMLTAVFSGCGKKVEKVQTGSSFTYWVKMDGTSSQTLKSYSEMMLYQEIEKRTGTKVEFIHPSAGSTGTEAFQILMSSGDYPDMIEYSWKTYTGGPQQAINDGVIIALNDYMKDYAPNYYDWMEGEKGKANNYLYKAQSLTNEGNYFGFRNMNIGTYRAFNGLYIRKDMLDKWGLDVPVTIDDWTLCLKTAKENGFKAPLTGQKALFSITGSEAFNGAWGVAKDWYIENGKVKFGPFEKPYKEYVAQMADWMKKGYVDIDYVTNAAENVLGYMTNDTSIASIGMVGSAMGKLLPAMEERNPDFSVVACPYPVLKKGEVSRFQTIQGEAIDNTIAITVQCGIDNEERYKEAISWCDYVYGEEGNILKCFGIEGETFTVEKGEDGEDHYVYTDVIYDHEEIGAHSVDAALFHFMRPANAPGLNQHPDYLKGFYPYEEQMDAIVLWNKNTDIVKESTFPPVNYTGEEATKSANIQSAARDNLDAAISNIILGKASIKEYDKAVKAAKKAGYDELIKINQAAYDRYIESIK